jgi:hypothetical protein
MRPEANIHSFSNRAYVSTNVDVDNRPIRSRPATGSQTVYETPPNRSVLPPRKLRMKSSEGSVPSPFQPFAPTR